MKYSERIKALREDRDLTQLDIAKVLGTTYQYYSTYEAGKRELPFSRAIALANYYNISLDYIGNLIDIPRPINEKEKNSNTNNTGLLRETVIFLIALR